MKTFFIAAIIAISAGAHAAPSQAIDRETYCMSVGRLATQAMRFRQEGHALSVVIDSARAISDESMRKLFKTIAITAYGRPAFTIAQYQQKSIVDFSAEVTTTCFASTKEGASQ